MRLEKLVKNGQTSELYLTIELQRTIRRLTENHRDLNSQENIDKKWATLLHSLVDGSGLKESRKTPRQHQWVTDGNRFLSGKDFINTIKLRVNAMPTRSRTARGRTSDRSCRAGCNAVETLNRVLQQCHRTHRARIERHNAIASYLKRALGKQYGKVDDELHFKTNLIAVRDATALVLDVQVVSEHTDLDTAHRTKQDKYKPLEFAIKERYDVDHVSFTTATLSYRGVWSSSSSNDLIEKKILKKQELKLVSTTALVGGLNSFWRFSRTTTSKIRDTAEREGVG
ncbi:Retrovirus-related Pol polyprotein from type-2 retrotransposable element R2DM [Anthophora retusa]